jgi:hypothetical protein
MFQLGKENQETHLLVISNEYLTAEKAEKAENI